MRRPGKHPNDPTPKHPTAPTLPAPLRLRSSTAALEEVRIIDTRIQRSTTKNSKNTDATIQNAAAAVRACRPSCRNRCIEVRSADGRECGAQAAIRPSADAAPCSAPRRRCYGRRWRARGAQDGACEGSRQCFRHGCGSAGASVIVRATRGRELLDGVAEGATPGTAQAKGPRAQQKSGERYGRRAPAYPPKGHTVGSGSIYTYVELARGPRENLSGKRTDGACAARSRIRPFFVHPDGAPTR